MPNRISYRNLPQLFLKAREGLMSHFRPILNHFGLTEQQWRILRILDERGQLEPWEICEICQILSSSMAGVLARMEDMELITRNRMPEDQRRLLVRTTSKGEALVSEIAPLVEAQYRYIEEAYGKELYRDIFVVLEKFVEAESRPIRHVEINKKSSAGTGKLQSANLSAKPRKKTPALS